MQTVSGLISRVLTTGELGLRDNQLQAAVRNHSVVETKKEKREIAVTQTTERKEVKFQFETDAARTTATSISRNNFNKYKSRHKLKVNKYKSRHKLKVEYKSRHKLKVKYKSRHKLKVKYKSRHKLKVKKLSGQYCAVMELQVLFKGTKCVHLWLGMWSYSLVAEHETHCVGPGLAELPSRDPTRAYFQNT
jgi:hypothetical protein